MKAKKKSNKRIIIIILVIIAISLFCFGGYFAYGSYKISQLTKMSSDEMIAYTAKDKKEAAITVGIIQNKKTIYTVYGKDGKILEPKEYTYEIGSITKTFTTSILCKAVSQNKISLDDSIDKYLKLPKKEYYPTMKRLVTHTSGYKNYYIESPMLLNFIKGRNDFYGINEDILKKRIEKVDVKDRDYEFNYSNFGIATVGAVLEQVYDEGYTTLINTYIKNDLGLANTKLSDGFGDLGKYWEWSDSDAYMPAGALLSNITDMMKYAQIQMLERPEYLSLGHKPLAVISANNRINEKMGINMNEVGAAWIIDKENDILWHNGGTENYNSYIGFDKGKQIAVVVLSNLPPSYRIPATVIGIKIMTTLQKQLY